MYPSIKRNEEEVVLLSVVKEAEHQTDANVTGFKRKPVYEFIKRLLDIFCSLLALIVLSPVFLIAMIAIYIDDPGPVIFKQIRIGKNGRKFVLYKFRSMCVNAEELKAQLMSQNIDQGANFKVENDPRITRVGRVLRKTSIDELPQLINILKGDMSIIGPRPFIESEQNRLPSDRLIVRPGLSCYWQIGGKNSLSMQEQIELDRKYIRERSLIVDAKIILLTLKFIVHNIHPRRNRTDS